MLRSAILAAGRWTGGQERRYPE